MQTKWKRNTLRENSKGHMQLRYRKQASKVQGFLLQSKQEHSSQFERMVATKELCRKARKVLKNKQN